MSWKSIKDISGDKGVIKTVTQEGEDWRKPADQDEVQGVRLLPTHTLCPVCSPRCPEERRPRHHQVPQFSQISKVHLQVLQNPIVP